MTSFNDMSKQAQWIILCTMHDEHFKTIQGPFDFHLTVNGVELDLNDFGDTLGKRFDSQVKIEAEKIAMNTAVDKRVVTQELKRRVNAALNEIYQTTQSLANVYDSLNTSQLEEE